MLVDSGWNMFDASIVTLINGGGLEKWEGEGVEGYLFRRGS